MSDGLTYTRPRHLTAAETAKLVRQTLRREFPSVKFSVRSKTYSGGASIDVSWADGPTAEAVDKVVGGFAGADFDGMVDLKVYAETWLLPDGTAQIAHREGTNGSMVEIITDPPHPSAELVRFGADFVFTHREISDEWREEILGHFERVIGRPIAHRGEWQMWREQVPLAVDRLDGRLLHMVETDTEDLSTVFHQYTAARRRANA